MARRQVVEIQCDRCHRVENQEPTTSSPVDEELIVKFQGKTIQFKDLCQRCRAACANYVRSITKEPEEGEKAVAAPPVEKVERTGFLGIGKKG